MVGGRAGRGLLVLAVLLPALRAAPGPCETETGQSSIILDIEESRGDQVNQSTTPAELPIAGQVDEDILLAAIFPKGRTLFQLEDKKLKLLEPLDRDEDNLSHIVFQLVCVVKATNKRRTIPVIVRVSDINDNAPVFQGTPYETTISELTPIGTTIFSGIKATDIDAGVNGLAEYFLVPGDNQTLGNAADGYSFFSIGLPHQGQVTVNRTLDFEKTQQYLLTIVASDRARNTHERYSSTATLTVSVRDDDDQDPSFVYQGCDLRDGVCQNPRYTASVNSGVLAGVLDIYPEKIQAVDMDTLEARIRYSIESGEPDSWSQYFSIDPSTGTVRQLTPVDSSFAKKFILIIKAEEQTEAKRFALATLMVTVRPVDANPPVIYASAEEGFVVENSDKGTKVLDEDGIPIMLTVSDADLSPSDPTPEYKFELTTNFFTVDAEGHLLVNEAHLDRDPPNPGMIRFQVVAREQGGSGTSAPLSLVVRLLDQNDNAPVIARIPPVTVPAHLDPTPVYKVVATDIDEGENARLTYSIYHVSNNGGNKFLIDPSTGQITSTGRLSAGEQYSISVRATDGEHVAQGIVEVLVAPGPNTRPPAFSARDYHAHVSEGAAINSTLTTVTAKDPENEQVFYSIVSGNDLRQFAIGATTGIITVIRRLDREDLTRYQLLVKAEDPGKLSSTATVNIKVTDINDNNPEFDEPTYNFHVPEGAAGATVGRVHAADADEGINAVVSYSLPSSLPFHIDNTTGVITTSQTLDYEKEKEYRFVVTATDGAPDRRLGTASVTVAVDDVPDEAPLFPQTLYVATVPENVANYPVAKIQALDPDTEQQITYVIRRGDSDLFSIDKSGMVRTRRPLDREEHARHELLIATQENTMLSPGATAVLEVTVEDKNDNTPIFTAVASPVTIDDSSSIGTLVFTALATDADATPPNNRVRYRLAGRGDASKYFLVEPDTGAVRIRDDLRKSTDSEYTVDVQGYDLGEPQLSSVTSVTVYVSHSATAPPEVVLGFADTMYTEHVSESAAAGALLRVLPVANKRAHPHTPLKCRLADTKGQFFVKLNEDRDCSVYLNGTLDRETVDEYSLSLWLEGPRGLLDAKASKCTLKLHVTDENDNVPQFFYPEESTIEAAKKTYFAIVTEDMILGTSVLQVKARDIDIGSFGKIEYQKNSWTKAAEEYFTLDSDTGVISTAKSLEGIDNEVLPFKIGVTARDNPGSTKSYNVARTAVVINLLKPEHQLVIEIGGLNAAAMRRKSRSVIEALESKGGLVAAIHRYTARHYLAPNGSLLADAKGTDLWFHLVDPTTGAILPRDAPAVQKVVSGGRAAVAARLQGASATAGTAGAGGVGAVRAPLVEAPPPRRAVLAPAAPLASALPAALLALATIVLLAAAAAVVYICASWNRYKEHKERSGRQYGAGFPAPPPAAPSVRSVPNYDSGSDLDSAPRYETQVLNMAVEDGDLQLDFSLNNNHAFSISNSNYLAKSSGGTSPSASEAATTLRASSVAGQRALHAHAHRAYEHAHALNNAAANRAQTQTLNRAPRSSNPLNNAVGTLPRAGAHVPSSPKSSGLLATTLGRKPHSKSKKTSGAIMAYDDNIPGTERQRASENDNVTFGKRTMPGLGYAYLDRSAVETTTEL